LSMALMLGAGLAGMQQQIQPGPEVSDRVAASARGALPVELAEALDDLQRCPIMADIFSADFLALYDMIKRHELTEQAADADFAIKYLLDRS
jgi:glutamine synthetase